MHAYDSPHSSPCFNALDYKFKLTAAFQKALDGQEAAVTLHYAHPPRTRCSPASTTLKRKQRHHYLHRGTGKGGGHACGHDVQHQHSNKTNP